MMEKKTRKSAPRPNSGRRGKDGAIGNLVIKNIRFTPDQAEWVTENGPAAVRQLVQVEIDRTNPMTHLTQDEMNQRMRMILDSLPVAKQKPSK